MEGEEIRKIIAKVILYVFGAYLFFTYIQRTAPDGKNTLLLTFIFTFFLNFGTNWAIYMLQGLAGSIMQRVLIFIQLGFFAWTFYAFRFVYLKNVERNYEAFFYTPFQQYAAIFPLFMILLIMSTRDK